MKQGRLLALRPCDSFVPHRPVLGRTDNVSSAAGLGGSQAVKHLVPSSSGSVVGQVSFPVIGATSRQCSRGWRSCPTTQQGHTESRARRPEKERQRQREGEGKREKETRERENENLIQKKALPTWEPWRACHSSSWPYFSSCPSVAQVLPDPWRWTGPRCCPTQYTTRSSRRLATPG